LDKGADINAKEAIIGRTALIMASDANHTEVVRLLLEKGADVNAKTKYGKTALALAKIKDHTDIVQLLEKAGAKE
jgi:ankyrin repeat protein